MGTKICAQNFGQVSPRQMYSWDILDMDKCHQDKNVALQERKETIFGNQKQVSDNKYHTETIR